MSAPTGTVYPGTLDTGTNIGSSVSSGQVIASAYADTSSSAILAIETALGTNPQGSDSNVGTALTARARKTDVQNQTLTYATSGGSANAYTLTLSPAPTAYAAGQQFSFLSNFTNTGAATLNVNTLGAINITKEGANALVAGDIQNNQIVEVIYDGTQFQMVSMSQAHLSNVGTIATNAPGLSVTQTWNASAVTFQAINVNVTNTASAAGSNVLQTQLAGTTKFSVGLNGSIQTSGVKVSVNAKSAAYTATSDDYAIVVTTGATTRAITLTANSSNKGQLLYIQKADSGAGAVTVTAAGSDKINGAATVSLASQYNSITLVADGAGNWLKISST